MYTIPREINSLPLAGQHGERTLGSVAPPNSSFCGLSTAPTCVSVLHVDAEPFFHGHSLQPCWLMLVLFDLVLIALHHSASSGIFYVPDRLLSCFQIWLFFPFFKSLRLSYRVERLMYVLSLPSKNRVLTFTVLPHF